MKLNTGLFHLLTTLWWLYWGLGQATGTWKDICAGRKALVECFGSNEVLLIKNVLYGKRPNCEKGEGYCLGAVDTDYANSIKGKCSGHHQCEFLVRTGTIKPDKGSCPGATKTTESNYMTVQYECVSDTTLMDVCSVTTTTRIKANFVSPGFPSQINTTSRPSECSCILNTRAAKGFYFYVYSYFTPEDCNIGEQLLTITNKDRAEEYSYPCSQLTDTTAKYLSKTKNIHIKFTSSINRGRFWFLIRDASSYESKRETIHISCNSHVTTPPLKIATTTDPEGASVTTGQLLTKHTASTSEGTSTDTSNTHGIHSHTALPDKVMWAVIGGVLFVIVIVIVIAIICYRKRRRKPHKENAVRFNNDDNKVSFGDEEDYPEDHTYAEVSDHQQGANTALKQLRNPHKHNEYSYAYSKVPDDNKNTTDLQGAYAYADVPRNDKNYSHAPDEGTTNQPVNSSTDAPTYAAVNKPLKNNQDELIENSLYEADVTARDTIPADVELVENDIYE